MAYRIASQREESKHPTYSQPSEDEIIGFVIPMIIGIGSLVAAYIGFRSYMQMGPFRQLTLQHGIGLMAIGCEGGVIFLTWGATRGMKIYQNIASTKENERLTAAKTSLRVKATRLERSLKTSVCSPLLIPPIVQGPIYGKEAWKMWNVAIADIVPEPPEINWEAYDPHFEEPYSKNYILLYIPKQIKMQGKIKDFGFETLEEISGIYFSSYVKDGLKNKKAVLEELQKRKDVQEKHYSWESTLKDLTEDKKCHFGWRLMSTKLTPCSMGISYEEMKDFLKKNAQQGIHFRMPFALEATILILMTYEQTGKSLLSEWIETPWCKQPLFTRTEDTVIQKYDETIPKPVCVGDCKSGEPRLTTSMQTPKFNHGTLAVKEFNLGA